MQSARKNPLSGRIPGCLPDLHVHTHYCGHAEGTMEESVQAAIRSGLAEVGFAGHFPYPQDFIELVSDCVIPEEHFPQFVDEVLRLRRGYDDRLKITLAAEKGIEITLGSDAHRPGEVGRYFRKTAEFLRTLGWTRVVVFEAGEKRYRSLQG